MKQKARTELGRFGHHPDPAIDFCVEVDAIVGMAADVDAGLADGPSLQARIADALEFRVGGDAGAIRAKMTLRQMVGDRMKTKTRTKTKHRHRWIHQVIYIRPFMGAPQQFNMVVSGTCLPGWRRFVAEWCQVCAKERR